MKKLVKNGLLFAFGAILTLLSIGVLALIGAYYDATYPFENDVSVPTLLSL